MRAPSSTPTSAARWSRCPSRRTSSPPPSTPRSSSPRRFNEAILDGRASITGGFTLDSARSLADQLKFGALPLSFVEQTSIDISPTLGSEQLRYGLIAGLIGLLLVVVLLAAPVPRPGLRHASPRSSWPA